ncbi:MAG: CHAP domain-containing protein, partial [Ruminococcus sp.]|nr:CHAP domain-containing protein [Ruminococcus sp.]
IYTNFINTSFSGMIGSSDFDTTVEDIWRALTVLSTEDEAKGYHSLAEFLSDSELNELHQALPALVYPILEFVAKDYDGYNQDHAGTLAYNAGRLIVNHYQEVPAAWARSYDSYYDNDTTPVTLKEGEGGKEAPHYPAVEVKDYATGEVTTYDGTTSAISVNSLDEVRLVPNNSSYKNTGEAIYYCYPNAYNSDYRGWHGFSDAIVFDDLDYGNYSDTGADGNTFTIDTFSAHYDMAANGTKTTGMTSAFDSTKRTYTFTVTKSVPIETTEPTGNGTYESGKYYAALQNVALTGNMRTDIVNIAKSQNGYMEGNNANQLDGTVENGTGNYTEYGRWYGLQDMWCAMFVSWCAYQAGVTTDVIPKTASTVTALNYFKKQGVAYTRASIAAGNYKPVPGDIIFFKSSRNTAETNHVGIVTGYSGTTITTIEGNTSSATISTNGGCVRSKSYSITNTYIVYVCRPKYPSDASVTDNVEFDGAKYDYRSWPNADTRWGSSLIGSGTVTVAESSGITTATVKLAIQAGLKNAASYNVSDFVTDMNQHNGYTAAGAMYWDVAKTQAGFTGVDNNLMSESTDGVSFDSEKQQILNWILEGKHLAISVSDSKGEKSWVAVDEAMTLSTGEIYIMDATTDLSANANVKAKSKYSKLMRVAGFTGGQIAFELIGSDDYRIWRKYDSRWKTTNIGGEYDVYAKGDLAIAATKLSIQAGLKNPQLFNVNNAIADIKTGSNGGFSTAGNMYWADAAQALGFDSYNANLLSSGTYSSTGYYDTIKNYINAGKHMVILVSDSTHGNNDTWVAVDEARTLSSGYIWVWRSNVDAVDYGEKTGDNMYRLDMLNSNFKRVACFTGGEIKSSEDHYVYLPGSFNGWKENREMTQRADGKCVKTVYLPKGNYEFKILADGYWYGNNGTIINTNINDNNGNGWEFTGEGNNCTLSVTYDEGGYFTFIFNPPGYGSYERNLIITYSAEPPQQGEVGPIIDTGANDYRKWNITDSRWGSVTLGQNNTTAMNSTAVGYGDLYVAASKLMISCGLSTPETMDPGKMAELIRSSTTSGMFDWDGLANNTNLTKVNTKLLPDGTYETRLGGKTGENSGKTFKQYILTNHYHLFVKIDDNASGYGWALVDEAMTASATGGEIYVWLSKSTNSKSTNDNPVLLSSISTTFKRVAAFSGGSNIVQANFSGDNNAEVTGEYAYNDMTTEINSGDYVPNGAAVTVKGRPAEGYQFDQWTHNLAAVPTATSSAMTYPATASATVTYKTKPMEYDISYSDESHFAYASGKPTSAANNASVSFTINPETDYVATVFVEKANGDAVSVTKSGNTYTFTMPDSAVNVSVEMNYEDYRTWSKSDSRWADTQLGTSSYKVSDTTAGMGDVVVAVTKLS